MPKPKPKGRNDGHEFDYSKITGKIIVGSDFCTGRICKEHKDEFDKLKVTTEINLAAERKEMPPDDVDSYSWIPVVDGYSPTQSQLDTGVSVIKSAVKNGKNVYVHCKNGHGRSPTLVIAYFMKHQNLSYQKAYSLVKKKRPEIHIENTQLKELKKFEKRND